MIHQSLILCVLFCLWIGTFVPTENLYAQPVLKDNRTGKILPVTYMVDSTQVVTDSLIFADSFRFAEWPSKTLDKTSLWIKATFSTRGDCCIFSRIGETVHVVYKKEGKVISLKNGRYLRPHTRAVEGDSRLICLEDVQAGDPFYINIPNFTSFHADAHFTLEDKKETLARAEQAMHFSFLLMGAILIIVTCSFAIFLIFRDLSYLWFSIYIVCAYVMSHLDLLGYLLGDTFPKLFLDDRILQIYFVACPVSLIGLCVSFFQIFSRSILWSRVFITLLAMGALCLLTIPFDSDINSQLILWFNLATVLLVALYAGLSYFGSHYIPGGYFLLAFVLPIMTSILIALDFLTVLETRNLSHIGGVALLIQSVILFIGVVKRYDRMNEDLIRVTLTKWEKEHEAKIFQLRNTELISQNEVIEKQKMLLAEQAEKLEAMNATKDKLLSVLSHDLRAPIGNLRSILSLLSEQAVSPEEFIEISEKLRNDVDRAYHMLHDVLHWVRSQYAGIIPNPVNFKLMEVVREVYQITMPFASEKDLTIDLVKVGDDSVRADRDHVHIILRNLLSNAVKFSNPSTVITITTERKGNEVEIRIHDKGNGMSEQLIAKILSGVKVESNRGTKGEKGTGLGLVLCREFIGLNGGRLNITSSPDQGTIVSFTLKAA